MSKIEIYKSKGKFRWRSVARNGNILASGQGFVSKQGLKKSLYLIKKSFFNSKTIDIT